MRGHWIVVCMGLAAAGCSMTPGTGGEEAAMIQVADVPFHAQKGFRCGSAAMASMLAWTGMKITPADVEMAAGADPRASMIETARRYGRFAYPIAGPTALAEELTAGHPVLVLENLGVPAKPLWNCAVAVGYDKGRDEILLHKGEDAARREPWRKFERLWADSDQWGLVVLNPGDLPAAARRTDTIAAARGLEKAGRYWEAVLAYDAALSQWPNDGEALMGLGSSLYRLGDAKGAAEAYTAAARLSPDPDPALAELARIKGQGRVATPD